MDDEDGSIGTTSEDDGLEEETIDSIEDVLEEKLSWEGMEVSPVVPPTQPQQHAVRIRAIVLHRRIFIEGYLGFWMNVWAPSPDKVGACRWFDRGQWDACFAPGFD